MLESNGFAETIKLPALFNVEPLFGNVQAITQDNPDGKKSKCWYHVRLGIAVMSLTQWIINIFNVLTFSGCQKALNDFSPLCGRSPHHLSRADHRAARLRLSQVIYPRKIDFPSTMSIWSGSKGALVTLNAERNLSHCFIEKTRFNTLGARRGANWKAEELEEGKINLWFSMRTTYGNSIILLWFFSWKVFLFAQQKFFLLGWIQTLRLITLARGFCLWSWFLSLSIVQFLLFASDARALRA